MSTFTTTFSTTEREVRSPISRGTTLIYFVSMQYKTHNTHEQPHTQFNITIRERTLVTTPRSII
jgi:hypothetical protein